MRVLFGVAVANSVLVGSIVFVRVGRSVSVGSVGVGVGRCVAVALGVRERETDRTSVMSEFVTDGVPVAVGGTDAVTAEGVWEEEGVTSAVSLSADVDGVAVYETLLLAGSLVDFDGDGVRILEFVSDVSSDNVTEVDNDRDHSSDVEIDAEDDASREGEAVALGVSVGSPVAETDRVPGVRVAVSVVSDDSVIVSVSLICRETEKLFDGVGGGVIVAVVVDDDELERLLVTDGERE